MRTDEIVMPVRMVAGAIFVVERHRVGGSRMLMIRLVALVRIVIDMVVLDRTNGCIRRMQMVAYVCRRSGATTHHKLNSERNEHHQ